MFCSLHLGTKARDKRRVQLPSFVRAVLIELSWQRPRGPAAQAPAGDRDALLSQVLLAAGPLFSRSDCWAASSCRGGDAGAGPGLRRLGCPTRSRFGRGTVEPQFDDSRSRTSPVSTASESWRDSQASRNLKKTARAQSYISVSRCISLSSWRAASRKDDAG